MPRTTIFRSTRRFQFWEFFVSHSQLLIRSPKETSADLNIDIVFRGVQYLSLPGGQGFGLGLELQEGDGTEFRRVIPVFPHPSRDSRIFFLCSNGLEFIIVARWLGISETKQDFMISGLERTLPDDKDEAVHDAISRRISELEADQ
jgi:hypothetical protein